MCYPLNKNIRYWLLVHYSPLILTQIYYELKINQMYSSWDQERNFDWLWTLFWKNSEEDDKIETFVDDEHIIE